jgi:hypothetical protein
MATWLNQLMVQFEIDNDKYSEIYNCLVLTALDTAEKVELLDEILSSMDPEKSELARIQNGRVTLKSCKLRPRASKVEKEVETSGK